MSKEKRYMHLSGLEPLIITPESNFINVGERTNVAGSKKFLRLIKEEQFEEAIHFLQNILIQKGFYFINFGNSFTKNTFSLKIENVRVPPN